MEESQCNCGGKTCETSRLFDGSTLITFTGNNRLNRVCQRLIKQTSDTMTTAQI